MTIGKPVKKYYSWSGLVYNEKLHDNLANFLGKHFNNPKDALVFIVEHILRMRET